MSPGSAMTSYSQHTGLGLSEPPGASWGSFWSRPAVTSELTGARTHGLEMNVAALCILFRPADFNETSDRHVSCFRVEANIHGPLGRPVFGNGGDSFYLIHIQSLFNKSVLFSI